MNKDYMIDCLSCILFRALGGLVRILPGGLSLFLGRRMGDALYYFDLRHKAIVYSNIKTALGKNLSQSKLNNLTHRFYRNFGQNLIEIFFIPIIDKKYLSKYVSIPGKENISRAFEKGKGVIFLAVHAGSWELSNIICANLGFPFSELVRNQGKFRRIEMLLNSYRSQKGCRLIYRQNQTRLLVEALKNNEAIGMTLDQGGKAGCIVKFFGKEASMATGAVRIGLKYGVTILPTFFVRLKGPYFKIIVGEPFEIRKTGNRTQDIIDNLQAVTLIFEKYITMHPQEYLWSYKIWKYGQERNILIVSDGKVGHLRQAQAVARAVTRQFQDKGIVSHINTVEVRFRNKLSKNALIFSSGLSGKYHCQGCLWCLRTFLDNNTYDSLTRIHFDIIISCGWAVAPINYVLSRENLAKSIAIMRPSILSTRRFDLVVMPKHDNPPKRKNVYVTEGALNLIDDEYKNEQTQRLIHTQGSGLRAQDSYIGLLIGGDTKSFHLTKDSVQEVIKQVKLFSEKFHFDILVTTSRRTSIEIERLIKQEFQDYAHSRLLVIANEKNIPEAVGGILGLSQLIVCSPESIAMISEATNSAKYVLVFKEEGIRNKHQRFLERFARNKYIYLSESHKLSRTMEDIWLNKPMLHLTSDNILLGEAIKKIL